MTDLARVQTELVSEAQESEAMLSAFQDLEVATAEDVAFAGTLLVQVKARYKELEAHRTSVTGPMNESLRQVNAWFKPVTGPLARAEEILKGKIGAYHQAQAEANARAMLQASEAARAGDGQGAATALATLAPAAQVKGVGVREVWDFEVVDVDLVPRQFMAVAMDRIRVARDMYLKENADSIPEIPGIRFFKRSQVSVRT